MTPEEACKLGLHNNKPDEDCTICELDKTIASMRRTIFSLKGTLDEKDEEIKHLCAKLNGAEDDIETKDEEIKVVTKRNQELHGYLDTLNKGLTDIKADRDRLRLVNEKRDEEIKRLKPGPIEVGELCQDCVDKDKEIKELTDANRSYEPALGRVIDDRDRLRSALEELKGVLLIPAVEYVPAISHALDIIDKALTDESNKGE